MCGILGIWNLDGKPVDPERLIAARDSMLHRGPNDADIFVEGALGLAHRRLSILDLSEAGRMPMLSDNQQCIGVFNGEIYNFPELRQELQTAGIRFRGHSDSEVVLNAYAQWGSECFERFNGMFAIGIWDKQRRSMVLARDPMGEKPLYFHWSPNKKLVFASSLTACWTIAPELKQIDAQGVSDYLRFGYTFDDQSLCAGVQKLHPGTVLEFSAPNICRATTYFDLATEALSGQEAPRRKAQEYEEELDMLLRDAVRIRMVADVPLGAFLSGGIDSSLIVAQMAQSSAPTTRTFTMGFEEAQFDESAHALKIAAQLGVSSQIDKLSTDRVLGEIGRVVHFYDEPIADYSTLPTSALSSFAHQHVTVALSGDGADELFAGYKYYIAQREFERYAKLVPRRLRAELSKLAAWLPPSGIARTLRRSDAPDAATYFGRAGFYRGAIENAVASELLPDAELAEKFVANYLRQCTLASSVEAGLLFDARFTLPGAWLHKIDRASMASGLELRAPFLDKRIVRFAFSLPLHMRLRRGTKKYLLRRVLGRYLPPKLFERPKQGFTAPIAQWLRGPLRSEASSMLSTDNLARLNVVDPKVAQKLLEQHLNSAADYGQILWALLTLVWWLEHHIDGRDLRATGEMT